MKVILLSDKQKRFLINQLLFCKNEACSKKEKRRIGGLLKAMRIKK